MDVWERDYSQSGLDRAPLVYLVPRLNLGYESSGVIEQHRNSVGVLHVRVHV